MPPSDVTLVETANSAILPVVRNKQAQIGCSTEPFVTQGMRTGVWDEPFINIPKMMGPYAYSTFNVRLDFDPEDAGAGARLRARHDEVAEIRRRKITTKPPRSPRSNFPPCRLDDLKATLDRSFADELWSKDGSISRASWDTAKAVVMGAGLLKADVKYDEIIDMSLRRQPQGYALTVIPDCRQRVRPELAGPMAGSAASPEAILADAGIMAFGLLASLGPGMTV